MRIIGRRWSRHLLGEVNAGMMEIEVADYKVSLWMFKVVEHILGIGFDVNAKSLDGWTPTI